MKDFLEPNTKSQQVHKKLISTYQAKDSWELEEIQEIVKIPKFLNE